MLKIENVINVSRQQLYENIRYSKFGHLHVIELSEIILHLIWWHGVAGMLSQEDKRQFARKYRDIPPRPLLTAHSMRSYPRSQALR